MALESLAPDQRAVLELILRQERSYEDLAGLLGISEEAVRRRAHAGVTSLEPPGELGADPDDVVDLLLGQADDSRREAALALLSASAPAHAWAVAVRERLRPVARGEIPGLPAAPEPLPPVPAGGKAGSRPRSSRRGGAILIGVCTVLAASLVAWLLVRGDGDGDGSAAPTSASGAPSATATATPQALAEIALSPVGGSKAKGLMQVNATQDGQVGIVVVAQDVEPSATDEAYAVWLTDARRKPFRIGFESKADRAAGPSDGTLAMSGPSPDIDRARFTRALTTYDRLVVSLETSDRAAEPARETLRGSLKRLQGGS